MLESLVALVHSSIALIGSTFDGPVIKIMEGFLVLVPENGPLAGSYLRAVDTPMGGDVGGEATF